MKKAFKSAIAILMVMAMLFVSAGAADAALSLSNFSDAPSADSWMYNGLDIAVENEIMNGANGKINPTGKLTRAEMIAMIVRVLGATDKTTDISKFVDVPEDAWYTSFIKAGVAIGIVNGSGNKMNPNAPISRQETFAILARAFMYAEGDHSEVHAFEDGHTVSDWAKDATAALIADGVVNGASGKINPLANVTRAEFETMLSRVVSVYINDPSDIPADKKITGNAVIKAPISLEGVTIDGNLYIADGVADGEVKLDNVTIGGKTVIRAGTVIKDGVDITPEEQPEDTTTPDDTTSGDNKDDDNKDDGNSSAGDSGNSAGLGGSTGSSTVAKLLDGSYITYSLDGNTWEKCFATLADNRITFDLAALAEEVETLDIEFGDLYIKATKALTCEQAGLGVTFNANAVVDVTDILAQIGEKGFALVSVAYEGEYPTLFELMDRIETAYLAYTDGGLAEIFESIDITCYEDGAVFAGKYGSKNVELEFIVQAILAE